VKEQEIKVEKVEEIVCKEAKDMVSKYEKKHDSLASKVSECGAVVK
jgi:hypothetical protein